MKGRDLAVVLVSGGMDSCVTAAIAAKECRLAFLHVSYGQRTEERERRAFEAMADHFGTEHRLAVRLEALAAIGGSCLTDASLAVPEGDPDSGEIPITYVPFRNTHLLASAVSWAEVLGARSVYIGAVEEDSSGYPDCRREYYDAFNRLVEAGTRPETSIEVRTPLIALRKGEIVRKGISLGAPFHLTWSCYRSTTKACGACDSCKLRLGGFREAGAEDPIPYARPVTR
jgi:7-cyano-7-deazaguanine synthase